MARTTALAPTLTLLFVLAPLGVLMARTLPKLSTAKELNSEGKRVEDDGHPGKTIVFAPDPSLFDFHDDMTWEKRRAEIEPWSRTKLMRR